MPTLDYQSPPQKRDSKGAVRGVKAIGIILMLIGGLIGSVVVVSSISKGDLKLWEALAAGAVFGGIALVGAILNHCSRMMEKGSVAAAIVSLTIVCLMEAPPAFLVLASLWKWMTLTPFEDVAAGLLFPSIPAVVLMLVILDLFRFIRGSSEDDSS